MKKILITGAGSYVGESVRRYILAKDSSYRIDAVDTMGDNWKKADYAKYDVVFHVAGIAHVNADPKMEPLYYKVNCNLTIEVAKHAKAAGVRQFIFMSSQIVFHESQSLKAEVLTAETKPVPNGFYGNSKLQAENGLWNLVKNQKENSTRSQGGNQMKICILRPCMIYGPNAKGNFSRLAKLACKTPVFPEWHNKRSMLYIDNLAEFVKQAIERELEGTFYPQNRELADTVEIVRYFAKEAGHKIWITKLLNPVVSMVPYECSFCTYLKELVEEGEVPMSRIDDAVRRVLRMKYRLGLFETPAYNHKDFPLFGGKEHAAAALQAAEESLVLLKNTDHILPLPKDKKLLITGPNANSMRTLNGGWSYTWQGHRADELAADYNTILESFTQKFGASNIIYEPGVTYKEGGAWWEENAPEIDKAVAAAANADYIIACVGENSYCETPGNLNNLFLSESQLNLVKALAATGKPVVLVLNEGRPRIVNEIEPLAKAVINTMLPGNYGGDALANLVAGDANFSGKMPYTYPKEINSLFTYDYKPCEDLEKNNP